MNSGGGRHVAPQIEEQSSTIAQAAPLDVSGPDATADGELGIHSVVELVARALCGLHRVNDHFVCLTATVRQNGCIEVEATLVRIGGEDATIRMLLQPSEPDTRPSPIGPGPVIEG
ncbi:MAG: hypothetical protein ACRDSH_18840 [Pseudonocardiaceae bacterium]